MVQAQSPGSSNIVGHDLHECKFRVSCFENKVQRYLQLQGRFLTRIMIEKVKRVDALLLISPIP